MDFRCLWHSPAYNPTGNKEWRFANKLTFCYVQWIGNRRQLVELEDHCTFLLTFRLTTLVDRPVTSALHRSEYFTPLLQESGSLFQALRAETACEWGWDLGSSRMARLLEHFEKMQRPWLTRRSEDQETSSIHHWQRPPNCAYCLRAGCSPSMMCAVKRPNIQHDQGLRTDSCD